RRQLAIAVVIHPRQKPPAALGNAIERESTGGVDFGGEVRHAARAGEIGGELGEDLPVSRNFSPIERHAAGDLETRSLLGCSYGVELFGPGSSPHTDGGAEKNQEPDTSHAA